MIPSPSSGWPNFAVSAATRMSHASASSQPPPRAYPLIAAIVGRGNRSISANSDELIAARPSSRPRARMSLMSAPETNADSPAPVMISAPAAASAASASSALRHSSTVSRFSAFLTAGRSIVSVAIDSETSTRIFRYSGIVYSLQRRPVGNRTGSGHRLAELDRLTYCVKRGLGRDFSAAPDALMLDGEGMTGSAGLRDSRIRDSGIRD